MNIKKLGIGAASFAVVGVLGLGAASFANADDTPTPTSTSKATATAGYLFQKGALDFAGGTVVHINAG